MQLYIHLLHILQSFKCLIGLSVVVDLLLFLYNVCALSRKGTSLRKAMPSKSVEKYMSPIYNTALIHQILTEKCNLCVCLFTSVSYPVPFNSAPVLQDLWVLSNTQTWIHLMSSITNHPFHCIGYCYCHVRWGRCMIRGLSMLYIQSPR